MSSGTRWWLTVLVAAVLIPAQVRGQDDKEATEEDLFFVMEELFSDKVESVSKYRQSILWSPSTVTTFTREDIRTSGATSIVDLLRRVPGFDIYSVKPSYTLVGARTLTTWNNNLVLLLIDGREALLELTGFALWNNLTIDLEEVERIEVIRGPGSALYGANALAAVVSITTVSDWHTDRSEVLLSGGEQGQQRQFAMLRGSFGLGQGTLAYGAGLGTEGGLSPSDPSDQFLQLFRTHGYVRYLEGNKLDLSLHAGTILGDATLMIFVGDMRAENFVTPWVMGQAGIQLGESTRLKTQVYYNRHMGDMAYRIGLRALGIWLCDLPVVPWDSHTVDGQVQLETELLDGLILVAGGNLRYSKLISEALIFDADSELRGAGFVHLEYRPLEILQLTGGVRLDVNTITDLAVSPRAVAVLRPWANHSFRLGYGLAFRKPSIFESQVHLVIEEFNPAVPEIVDKLAEEMGNPKLENVKVHSFEAGWKTNLLEGRLVLSLDLFYSLYRDPIDFEAIMPIRLGLPDIRNSSLMFLNDQSGLDSYGGEVEVQFRPDLEWYVWANLGLRKVTWHAAESEENERNEPLARANIGAGLNPETGFIGSVSVHYVSSYGKQLVQPDDQVRQAGFTDQGNDFLLIGRAGYRIRGEEGMTLETGFTIRTPLGAPFREAAGTRMPDDIRADTRSDFGGENVIRLVSVYLRGSF